MITIQILEDDDTIQATDWCRPLVLVTMSGGMSDYYSFESMYSGAPENNVKWVPAFEIFPAWIGNTVGELNEAFDDCSGFVPYEIVRGDIPKAHQYGKTKRQRTEDYNTYLETTVAPGGKFKGKTWKYIKEMSPGYFEWAVSVGYAKPKPTRWDADGE